MNKANLKASWGAYCDTDKLVDDLMALFTKYNHRNSEHGVCKMLDTYFANKRDLIDMLQKSPHYIGDMRVCIDEKMERYANKGEISNFCGSFSSNIGAEKVMIKYKDEDGKTLGDYLKTGIEHVNAKDFMVKDSPKMKILKVNKTKKNRFNTKGETVESRTTYSKFVSQMDIMRYNCASTLNEEYAKQINSYENVKLVSGMKTARAFNRICAHYGIDKCKDYNKLFAEYADMVSGLKRNIKFFISLNPMDYLLMSNGVNWKSCHNIQTGAWKGGCLSYMLDNTSIITFVHDHVPTDWEEGKIYRCMFHYGNDLLVQSRIYPQGNDGNLDLYSVFRGFVQKEIAVMLDAENNWVEREQKVKGNITSVGVHYKDYNLHNECSEYFLREKGDCSNHRITIGHKGICPYCGEEITSNGSISHSNCIIPTDYAYTNSPISYTTVSYSF